MTTLFLSPHLDDVALSASIAVLGDVARGERVVVATFFTEGRDGALRRDEDRVAMRVLGADAVHVGLVDFPERRGVAPSFRALCVDRDEAAEAREMREAEVALGTLLEAVRPTRVVLPLGMGGHVDHRLVAALAPRVAHLPHAFYEDFPYAMVAPWVDAAFGRPVRVDALALHASIDAALPGFAADAADAARLAAELTTARAPARSTMTAEILTPHDADLALKLEAIESYRSQSAVALGGQPARVLFARHARDTGLAEGAERLWSP